ncbi:dienelactone hydrolase family protein [Aminobacterium sp. MB27-C1]|jgi:dienelactone hydrolase|uniref:dienelactone hydrolase family protein n=2 Tax=unclassified Aminobacterium TaxID=2685012 RepID=UPI001BD179A6|nr:dienelactone hydrolase family protein [Aminobacterium sp. MB27-C1]MDD3708541.1 dienelactone hydrolase family protein [Aminobacterium sp.]MDD4229606.1 dienelactone hydrolase family protein [Aminobacterium sp.]WMI70451.1 dienelactone hydrolase family protein [Aminobacterium sp. MB27-C1]
MYEYKSHNTMAIIVLHEIYGLNNFIEDVCAEFHGQGFDVFCPDMLRRDNFSYAETHDAYEYFVSNVGFDVYKEIESLIKHLALNYEKIFIIGFSIGATIAWRCCENVKCNGIICCYGSRIRDYLFLQPFCPTLLLFAEQDSFNVDNIVGELRKKSNVEIFKLEALHGFMDKYAEWYNSKQTQISNLYIHDFIKRNIQ